MKIGRNFSSLRKIIIYYLYRNIKIGMTDLERLIESNAKAIEALTLDIAEMKRDRDTMYQLMQDLTQNQSRIYNVMQQLDNRQNQLTDRQQQLIEIQKQSSRQQEQIAEILSRLTER
jgi:FtsZ-binding cell division protein ZapB